MGRIRYRGFQVSLAGLVLALILSPAAASGQGQAEYDLLRSLAGEYTYDYTELGSPATTGRISFEPFAGGQFLKFEEQWGQGEGDTMGILGIVGFDALGGYFTWYRVFDNGAYDHARGTLENGTITFMITESRTEQFGPDDWAGPGIQLRTMWTDFSEDGWTFLWDRSVDGGPWERLSEGKNTRVR